MRLPPDWKKIDRLYHGIVARLWPELERCPYTSVRKGRATMIKLQRAMINLAHVVKETTQNAWVNADQ